MKRQVKKYVEKGSKRIRGNKDLYCGEIADLYEMSDGSVAMAIGNAFYMGVEVGARMMQQKGRVKQ